MEKKYVIYNKFARLVFVFLSVSIYPSFAEENESFFPFGASRVDSFVSSWYSSMLTALGEKSIYRRKSDATIEVYRFTCLRTFHHPFSIRIEVTGGTSLLFFKMTDGQGGYQPGQLITDERIILGNVETDNIRNLFKKEFLSLESREKNKAGCDGSQWIIEYLVNGKYHIVDRWTPIQGPVYSIGKYFIDLSKGKIDELY